MSTTSESSESHHSIEMKSETDDVSEKVITETKEDNKKKKSKKQMSSSSDSSSSSGEEIGMMIEEVPNVIKKHPNCCQIAFFQRAPEYVSLGRKGSLNVYDIGAIPSTLNIENTHEKYRAAWEKELTKNPQNPSLFKTICRVEGSSFLICAFACFFSQLTTLIMPAIIQFLVNWVTEDNPAIWEGIVYLIAIAIMQLFTSFCFQLSIKWVFVCSLRLRNGLISMIYQKALKLNSASIQETGKLVNLMSNDAMLFVEQLPIVFMGICAPLLFIIILVILICLIGYWAFVPMGICLFFAFLNIVAGYVLGIFFGKSQFATDKRLNFFGEILRNIKFIKYNAWEEPLWKRLKKLRNKEIVSLGSTLSARAVVTTLMVEVSPLMAFVIFLIFRQIDYRMDVGKIFTCIAYFNVMRMPFQHFGYLMSTIETFKIALGRLKEFFVTEELQPQEKNVNKKSKYAINMKDVEFKFPNGETAFSCDELKIKKGELVCVLGSVGSGKSSLLMSILGELEKSQGTMEIGGDITYASQTAWLMNTSVRENICFLQKYNRKQYAEACRCACLNRDLQILRGGDQYEVAERGANLSGGQRQRISIARALYNAKDIVIFDDPLSAVDFQVGSFIFENAMAGLLKDKTRIIVTNQTYFIDKADRIIVMEDKKIAFNGTIEELRKSNIEASQFVKTVEKDDNKKKDNKKKKDEEDTVPQDVVATDVQEEERSVGGVAWSTYKEYFKSGGWFGLFLSLIPFVCKFCVRVFYNISMSNWTNSFGLNEPHGDGFWFYANAISIGAEAICLFVCMIGCCIYGLLCSNGLHSMMVSKLFKTLLSFFDVTPVGRLQNYFSRDLRFADFRLPSQYEMLFNMTFDLVAVFVTICMASYWMIIVIVVVLIVFLIFHKYFVRASIEMQRLEGVTRSPMFIHFDQTLLGLSTVRNYKGQQPFLRACLNKMKNNTLSYYTLQIAKSWYGQRLDWVGCGVAILTVLVIVVMKLTGTIEPGVAGVALMNVASLGGFVTAFSQNILETDIVMQSVERVLVLKNIQEEETSQKRSKYREPPASWPSTGKIKLSDYKFRYREGLPLVLKGVSAKLKDKEKIGVVGRTGSGKSTMMAGLFRIEEPAGGRITIDGIDTRTIPLKTLRSRMCILPQEATMFSGTIRSNLDPFGEKTDEEMKRVLQLVHIDKDLDYEVTENGENFSLGERQMICMARALLKKSKILIMDEATASIDIQTDIMIQEMVRKNFNDCTTLTIAHRLHSIMDSNRVMVFDDGHLMEYDTPLNLIDQNESIFNSLVQQSGCPDELKRLAKGEMSIADSLMAEDAKKNKKEKKEKKEKKHKKSKKEHKEDEHNGELVNLNTPSISPMPANISEVENRRLLKGQTPSPLPDEIIEKKEEHKSDGIIKPKSEKKHVVMMESSPSSEKESSKSSSSSDDKEN